MRKLGLALAAALLAAPAAAEELSTVDVAEPDELPELPPWEWAVSGVLQADGLTDSDIAESGRENDMKLRRARLSTLLQYRFDWQFRVGVDVAEGPELREAAIEYRGFPVHFEFGRIVEPFGVLQGGSRGAALMERPQATGLAPGYGFGVAANGRGERWTLSGGLYSATRNSLFEGGRKEDALTARGTWTPLRGSDHLVHLGAAVSQRESAAGFLEFVAIPESVLLIGFNASSALLFSTGGPDSEYRLYGGEFGVLLGPVLVQSEYMLAELDPVIIFDDADESSEAFFDTAHPRYQSWYVEAAWAISGERRDYSSRRGVFGGIHPGSSVRHGGWGAFEVAARHSDIDLADDKIGGERGRVSSIGLNWYPEYALKLMVTALRAREIGENGAEEVSAVQARVQIRFDVP